MKKKTTETGRRVRSPKIQNVSLQTKLGRAVHEALKYETPKLNIDYSAVEQRIMERIKK